MNVHNNPTRQVVCYTEPCGKALLETVWERAGTFKKHLAGDWSQLVNQIFIKASREKAFPYQEKPPVPFFALLSIKYTL